MGSQEIDIKIKEWLGTVEALAVLDRVARAVSDSALFRKLSLTFLTKDPFGAYAPDDLIEDVKSELALFIIENSSNLSRVLTSENRNPHPFLKQAFINYWITKTRTAGSDPQRYFYKRVQDVLRQADGFHIVSKKQKSIRFSLMADNTTIPQLCEEDIRAIALPVEYTAKYQYESISKKDVLVRLTRYFWEQVSEIWGHIPVWVDVRDFIAWIGLHISLKAPLAQKEGLDGASVIDGVPDDAQDPDALYYDRDLVKTWAENFSNCLSEREKAVFSLSYGSGLKLSDVARELDYKGSSGPKYILECIEGKLRLFLRDLPWLSLDDFNKDAFNLFIDIIVSILKKGLSKP